jgi:hypothetical protein
VKNRRNIYDFYRVFTEDRPKACNNIWLRIHLYIYIVGEVSYLTRHLTPQTNLIAEERHCLKIHYIIIFKPSRRTCSTTPLCSNFCFYYYLQSYIIPTIYNYYQKTSFTTLKHDFIFGSWQSEFDRKSKKHETPIF